jgi:hypothetical protein
MAYIISMIAVTLIAYMLHQDWRDAVRSRGQQRRRR